MCTNITSALFRLMTSLPYRGAEVGKEGERMSGIFDIPKGFVCVWSSKYTWWDRPRSNINDNHSRICHLSLREWGAQCRYGWTRKFILKGHLNKSMHASPCDLLRRWMLLLPDIIILKVAYLWVIPKHTLAYSCTTLSSGGDWVGNGMAFLEALQFWLAWQNTLC